MKKKFILLSILFLSVGMLYGQTATATETDSNSGSDSDPVVSSVTFNGLPTGAFITNTEITTTIGDYVGIFYDMNLDIGGNTYYNVGELTNASYADINGLDPNGQTITVTSVDTDDWGDGITLTLEVTITYGLPSAPELPTNPNPADGAIDVAIDGSLTWDFGADTDTYDLWFGEAGALAEVVTGAAAGASGSYSYSNLNYSTGYEWQLIAYNSSRATTTGPTWSFETISDPRIIQIGSGSQDNKHVPIEPYYAYSYSQSIYLASDFNPPNADMRIEKLWYNYTWVGNAGCDNWTIYMDTTSDTNLDSGFLEISTFTQVFSGDVNLELVSGDGWIEIVLDTPFDYDPALDGNLVIAVDENDPNNASMNDEFYCDEDTRANVSRYEYGDWFNPDPNSPPTGTATAFYPNTRFFFNDMPATPILTVNPTTYDFGTVNLGTTSAAETFTISNTGDGTLTITDVSLTGLDTDQFVLTDGNTYSHDLGAGESITVDVAFAPTSEGAKTANFTISDSRATTDVPLSGTGYNTTVTTFPYLEEFNTFPPVDWDMSGGTRDWSQYNSECAEARFWDWPAGNNALMTTLPLDITALDLPYLEFDWSHIYSSTYPNDELNVLVSDDNGNTWTSVWNKAGTDLDSNDGAGNTTPGSFVSAGLIDLSAYTGQIMIMFDAISGMGPGLFVDNVIVYGGESNSQPPVPGGTAYNFDGGVGSGGSTVTIYPPASGGNIVVTQYNNPPGTLALQNNALNLWFDIDGSTYTGGFPVDITFEWDNPAPTGISAPTLLVSLDDGNSWINIDDDPDVTVNSWNLESVPYSVNFTTSHLSKWVMGNGEDNPLPVTLTNFTAAYFQSEFVSVTWTTESETSMNCYYLYRSETGPDEQLLINTQYALNSTSTHSYEFQDYEVENGITYSYWLEAVAYDGSSTEYGPTAVTIEGEETPELPHTTLLYGNYPNPFNPVTNIKFDIKEGETAILTIYNIRSRVVEKETFTANEENIGRVTYNWDASKYGSGVYFYRLSSESYTEVKKMLLLK